MQSSLRRLKFAETLASGHCLAMDHSPRIREPQLARSEAQVDHFVDILEVAAPSEISSRVEVYSLRL